MARKLTINADSVVVSASFKLDDQKFSQMGQRMHEGLFAMGFDIAAQARRNAPVITGALRNSIRPEADDDVVYVRAGGTVIQDPKTGTNKRIDYAMKREQGPNRNPATEHYMENAYKLICSGDYMTKYFGGITQ